MNQINHRRGFTLAELIVAIAILAFFSTIVVQVFAQAQTATERAEELDQAVVCVSDLADQWKSTELEQMDPPVRALWTSGQQGGMAEIFYDASFLPCSEQDASYQVNMVSAQETEPHVYKLTVTLSAVDGGEPIYQLLAGCYAPQRGGAS